MKAVKGYTGYFATKSGFVISKKHSYKKLKGTLTRNGYLYISLCKRNVARKRLVHRVIAETLLPKIKGKPHVNHINGIKTDNRLVNLEWCTAKENCTHSCDNGLNVFRRPVHQYSITGRYIRTFVSMTAVSKFLGTKAMTHKRLTRKKFNKKYIWKIQPLVYKKK